MVASLKNTANQFSAKVKDFEKCWVEAKGQTVECPTKLLRSSPTNSLYMKKNKQVKCTNVKCSCTVT